MTAEITPPSPLFERWGVLELEEGLRLWAKAMLVYVATEKGPPLSQQLRVFTAVVTEADARFKSDPTSGPLDPSGHKPAQVYESITVVSPAESFYQLPNGVVLSLRLRPVRARRYDLFGADRDPVIQVEHAVEMGTISSEGVPTPARVEVGQRSSPTPSTPG